MFGKDYKTVAICNRIFLFFSVSFCYNALVPNEFCRSEGMRERKTMKGFFAENRIGFLCTLMLAAVFAAAAAIGGMLL
jgi:hypothetical protein